MKLMAILCFQLLSYDYSSSLLEFNLLFNHLLDNVSFRGHLTFVAVALYFDRCNQLKTGVPSVPPVNAGNFSYLKIPNFEISFCSSREKAFLDVKCLQGNI
ncbi:hypothetical protein M758_11G113800 [Ceratodon purpureus]|nr:hypothetical protein M758_11G113800 [Ceratodon purpureus]